MRSLGTHTGLIPSCHGNRRRYLAQMSDYNYVYWSDRAVSEILDGKLSSSGNLSITIPSIFNLTPEISWGPKVSTHGRKRLSRRVERFLRRGILMDPTNGVTASYVAGCGSVEFGEFVSPGGDPFGSLMLTRIRASDGTKVVVCLFGSLENYSDYIGESGPATHQGWTASGANFVRKFLEGQCQYRVQGFGSGLESRPELARYVHQIASCQGMGSRPYDSWNRGYTYGDIRKSGEWLAQIYYDLSKEQAEVEDIEAARRLFSSSFDRVIIGRPIWLRARRAREIRLYSQYTEQERLAWPKPVDSDRYGQLPRGLMRKLRGIR